MELKLYPDRTLRRRCRPLLEVDGEVTARAQEMLEFMYQSEGVGLAGPQIGWCQRICTLDPDGSHDGRRIFVNPLIVHREGYAEHDEGCLSLPGIEVRVPRSAKVAVVAYTLDGERVEMEAEDLAACAWQHELDHLNGVLIIDRVPPTTLLGIREQLKKLEEAPSQPKSP
jgi:peptide deformylase